MRSGALEQTRGQRHRSEKRSESDSIQIYSNWLFSLHSLFPPFAVPTHVESNMTVKEETPICYYSELVLESVINSLVRREAQLTSHKATRTTATFTMSSEIDFRKSTFGSRMFEKLILWGCGWE